MLMPNLQRGHWSCPSDKAWLRIQHPRWGDRRMVAAGAGSGAQQDEKRKAREAINEWADGEAIAAHVAYGNDLFCTQDEAKGAGSQSVFSSVHRKWLENEYGIVFVPPCLNLPNGCRHE